MNHVHITGAVDANGGFTPGWWYTPPPEAVSAAQAYPDSHTVWEAVALDDADDILARAPAPLSTVQVCPGEPYFRLDAMLGLPDTTSSVAIIDGDREVFRRAVLAPARVSLDERLGTSLRRQPIKVGVRIDGPEPRSGAYLVARWEAPSQPPLPLGLIDVGAGEPVVVDLDLTGLPGGEGCRLSVTYGDGIRTVAAFSEPLYIEPRAAVPVIVAPTPSTELFDDSWLSLEGRLDGDGDPEALEWLLDEELIGTGVRVGVARPGAGTRTVTLRYGTAYTSIEIMILPAPTEERRPPLWTPPWRSGPFRSVSTIYLEPGGEPETTE